MVTLACFFTIFVRFYRKNVVQSKCFEDKRDVCIFDEYDVKLRKYIHQQMHVRKAQHESMCVCEHSCVIFYILLLCSMLIYDVLLYRVNEMRRQFSVVICVKVGCGRNIL